MLKDIKTKLFSYLTYKVNINRLDELTNWPPVVWLKKFFIQRMITYDFPQHIFLETTSACNLKCRLCPRTAGNTLVGHMDFELFKKIVNEANQYGPRTFCLHLFGEPLLAPRFIDEIYYIKQINPKNTIVLTTNGTVLDEKIAEAMVKTPVDKMAVSFVSAVREKYTELTGINLLDKVEQNVRNLLAIKEKNKAIKPKIIVRMILEEHNQTEVEIFKNKWQSEKVIVEVRPAHNYGGNVNFGHVRDKKIKQRWPCYHFWLSPAIHWNGDFSVCCNDYARKAVLGNVGQTAVNKIWNSVEMQNLRAAQLRGDFQIPTICEKCDVWTMYHDIFFKWQKH